MRKSVAGSGSQCVNNVYYKGFNFQWKQQGYLEKKIYSFTTSSIVCESEEEEEKEIEKGDEEQSVSHTSGVGVIVVHVIWSRIWNKPAVYFLSPDNLDSLVGRGYAHAFYYVEHPLLMIPSVTIHACNLKSDVTLVQTLNSIDALLKFDLI